MGELRVKVLRRILEDLQAHHYTDEQIQKEIAARSNANGNTPIPEGASLDIQPADHVIFKYKWGDDHA